MKAVWNYSPHDIIRLVIVYGFLLLSIVDSILILIASRRGIKENIAGFPNWIGIHHKYGIWKVNFIKIVLSIIFPYPEISLNPRLGILFLYLFHVIIFSYRLFFRKYEIKKDYNENFNAQK